MPKYNADWCTIQKAFKYVHNFNIKNRVNGGTQVYGKWRVYWNLPVYKEQTYHSKSFKICTQFQYKESCQWVTTKNGSAATYLVYCLLRYTFSDTTHLHSHVCTHLHTYTSTYLHRCIHILQWCMNIGVHMWMWMHVYLNIHWPMEARHVLYALSNNPTAHMLVKGSQSGSDCSHIIWPG